MLNPSTLAPTNYFAAEAAIVARLQAEVFELKSVYTTFSIADMQQASQNSPAAHVIYVGDNVLGAVAGRGERKVVDQRWMVVLAVRNARAQLQDTSAVREDAGALIPKILNALSGWSPVEYMRPLERAQAPAVGYSSTFAYFPFLFEGRLVT